MYLALCKKYTTSFSFGNSCGALLSFAIPNHDLHCKIQHDAIFWSLVISSNFHPGGFLIGRWIYSYFKWPYEYIHYMKFAILCAKTYHSAQHVQSQSIFNYLLIKSCLLVFAKKTVGICILILVKNWRAPMTFLRWNFYYYTAPRNWT